MNVYTRLELTEKVLQVHVISEHGEFFCISVAKPVNDEETVEEWLPRLEQRYGENLYKYFSGDKGSTRWNRLHYDIKSQQKLFKALLK